MKGSANLPPSLESSRGATCREQGLRRECGFLDSSRTRHPALRPVGGDARQATPIFRGPNESTRRERGRRFPAPTGIPSLSVLGSLCLRAAYTNGSGSRTRAAVSEVDLVQGSTGEARPRGALRSGKTWVWKIMGQGAEGGGRWALAKSGRGNVCPADKIWLDGGVCRCCSFGSSSSRRRASGAD
ncbi:hypothetical protein LX36DRAFT_662651 [Colletotrichum falcatum]|nr:hypothetical protein LX36DRAFT_662651 [Colletotrichum falcatum]